MCTSSRLQACGEKHLLRYFHFRTPYKQFFIFYFNSAFIHLNRIINQLEFFDYSFFLNKPWGRFYMGRIVITKLTQIKKNMAERLLSSCDIFISAFQSAVRMGFLLLLYIITSKWIPLRVDWLQLPYTK